MIITMTSEEMKKPLTESQIKMLEALKDRPVEPDEDCPEQTAEQLREFKRVSKAGKNKSKRNRTSINNANSESQRKL